MRKSGLSISRSLPSLSLAVVAGSDGGDTESGARRIAVTVGGNAKERE